MLSIEINNTLIDLSPRSSIRFSLISPLFNDVGSFSFPFNIPSTSKNKDVFGFPGRIENKNKADIELDCVVKFNNIEFLSGKIKFVSATNKQIKTYMKLDKGVLNSILKDTYMNDEIYNEEFDLGASTSAAVSYLEDVADGTSDDYDFACFPLFNYDLLTDSLYNLDDQPHDNSDTLLAAYRAENSQVNNYFHYDSGIPGYVQGFDDNMDLSIFPYVRFLIKKFCETHGFTVNDQFFNDDELKQLCLYNNYWANYFEWDVSDPLDPIAFYVIKTAIDLKDIMPEMLVSDFIKGLESFFNITFFSSLRQKKVIIKSKNDLIDAPVEIDLTNKLISIEEVSNIITDGFEIIHEADGDDNYISKRLNDWADKLNYRGQLPTVSSLPTTSVSQWDVYFVWETLSFYAYTNSEWTFYSINHYQNHEEGNAEEKISSILSSPAMYKTGFTAGGYLCPRVDQQGSSDYIQIVGYADPDIDHIINAKGENKPKLMFYRGKYDDSNGDDYPLGSTDVYDYDDNIIANYSLKPRGDYGLWENFFKKWYNHKENFAKNVKVVLNLSIYDLLNIEMYKKIRIGENNYFIVDIDLTINKNGISPATLNLYKL